MSPVDQLKALNIYHLFFFSSINVSNLLLKISTVLALTTCLLSLFHSSSTLLENQFVHFFLLNLNLSSSKPFVHVLTN